MCLLSRIIPARLVLTFLGFLGHVNLYAMRVNLSVAMVAMVGNQRPTNGSNETMVTCPELVITKNQSLENAEMIIGEFDWDSDVQGQVIGSFFYGYFITQIPGGVLAEKYGGKWFYGVGVLAHAVFTLLTPVAARLSVWLLIAVRVVEGMAGAAAFPAMNVLISRWVPKMERSRIQTAMFMGVLVGTISANMLTGILCESSFLGGWPSVFYLFGFVGCIWFVLWAVLIYEYPEDHPRISKSELIHIQEGTSTVKSKNICVPWKSIWTSLPMWAVIVAHFGQNWAFYTLLTMMPTYLSNVLHFDMKDNGIVSGLPYMMMIIFALPASFVADKLRESERLQITTIRKIMNTISFFGPASCAVAVAFTGCHPMTIIAIFILSFGLNGLIYSGYIVSHVDMSPQFAGTLYGITNGIATLPGFLAPAFIGYILSSGQTLKNWEFVFLSSAAFHFLSGLFYIMFASAEEQPWNEVKPEESSVTRNDSLYKAKVQYNEYNS